MADSQVDLLPSILPHVINEQSTCPGLESKREWISQAKRPNCLVITGHRWIIEVRIVGRNKVKWIGVYAQQLSKQVRECLCVCAIGILSDRNVQLAVRSKVNCATIVIGCARKIIQVEDNQFATRYNHIAVRCKSAYTVVDSRRCRGVINIHELIVKKIRIKRDPQQSTLSC